MSLIELTQERFKSDTQRRNALDRIAKYEPAKQLVLDGWRKEQPREKKNFAYRMQIRIKNQLKFDVATRTIEGWLPPVRVKRKSKKKKSI